MATVRRTRSFLQDYQSLPKEIQVRVDKQLGLLLEGKRRSLRLCGESG